MEIPVLKRIEYTKIVQSGDLIEVYEYESSPTRKRNQTHKKKVRYRKYRTARSAQRAKDNFRRMVRSMLSSGPPDFVTLTMATVESIEIGYRCFTEFTTRLRRTFGKGIKWVAVPEFQKRGAVHFHALIWGLPDEIHKRERDTRDLQAEWLCGWLDILRADTSPKLASYLAKYMYKGLCDDRLAGKKSYTASRGNMRSVLLNTQTSVAIFKEEYPEIEAVDKGTSVLEIDRVYKTKWLGRCRYRRLVVKK